MTNASSVSALDEKINVLNVVASISVQSSVQFDAVKFQFRCVCIPTQDPQTNKIDCYSLNNVTSK